MNQILMVENKKKKNKKVRTGSGDIQTSTIVRFFAIVLIIFAIFFVGQGSYAIYKDMKGRNKENLPVVTIKRINDTVLITAKSSYKIENLVYTWNTAEETKIPVEASYAEETVYLPMRNSILNVRIEEDNGRSVKYQKVFNIEGLDISQPTIEVTEEGAAGNIRISATDETEMAYITYKINDKDEIRIDKSQAENTSINYVLKLEKGENNLVVTAVDTSGNVGKLEKKIIVSGKTTVSSLKIENGRLVIVMEDPDGIKDIDINLNGRQCIAKDVNKREGVDPTKVKLTVPIDLVEGTNSLKISITNVNSLVTTGAREFNYVK